MAQYTVKDALQELEEIRLNLESRVDELITKRDAEGIAYLLFSLRKEIDEIEREARRLRLKGELDLNIYRTLISGYQELTNHIMKESDRRGLREEVRSFYTFLLVESSRGRSSQGGR